MLNNWYKLAAVFGEPYFRALEIPEENIKALLDYLEPLPKKIQKHLVNKYIKKDPTITVERLKELFKDVDVQKETKIDPEMEKMIVGITDNKDEREWLRKLVQSGRFQAEDSGKLIDFIDELHSLPDDLKKPISDFKDDIELSEYIDRYRPKKELEEIPEGAELLENYDTDVFEVQLYRITTQEAMKEMAAPGWCVAHGAKYELPYYCFYINGQPEVLINLSSDQIKDKHDRPLSYGPFIRAIAPVISKYGLDAGTSSDFSEYNEAVDKIEYLDATHDEEYITEIIKENVVNIALLDKEHWSKYLHLLDTPNVIENLTNIGPTILHHYAAYVKSKSPEEFENLHKGAIEWWVKRARLQDLTVGRYKKVFPKILRTPYANGVFNAGRKISWQNELETNPALWDSCPEDLKSDPEILQARKQGFINYLTYQDRDWEEVPDDLRSDPEIKMAWRQGWVKGIEKDVTTLKRLPDALKSDPEILEARRQGWIKASSRGGHEFMEEVPDDLKSDPEIFEGWRHKWILISQTSGMSWKKIPEDLRSDPEIIEARRQGWIRDLHGRPNYAWKKIPEDLKSDPEILQARKQGFINYLTYQDRDWEEVPDDLKSDPEIKMAWRQGWIKGIEKNVTTLKRLPDALKSDPEIPVARKKGWIRVLSQGTMAEEKIPEDLKSDPEIVEARRARWVISIESWPQRSMEGVPEEFKSDPEILQAWKKGWMIAIEEDPLRFWKLCPEEFKNDPEIIEVMQGGWVEILSGNPDLWGECPEKLKSYPDIIAAHKNGWSKKILGDPMLWDDCPEEFKSDPKFRHTRRQGWKNKLRSGYASAWEACPEEFKSDPAIIRIVISSWMSGLKEGRIVWENIPDDIKAILISNSWTLYSIKKYFVRALHKRPKEWENCPEELKSDPDIIQARKQGWIYTIQLDARFFWEEVPDDLKSDPDVIESKRQFWIKKLSEIQMSNWTPMMMFGVPDDLKSDPEILQALKTGCLLYVPIMCEFEIVYGWRECPEMLKSDPEIVQAFVNRCQILVNDEEIPWEELPDFFKQRIPRPNVTAQSTNWYKRSQVT